MSSCLKKGTGNRGQFSGATQQLKTDSLRIDTFEKMKNLTIPPAPLGAARPKTEAQTTASAKAATAPASPLDAAFIARVYRSMLWFGIVCTAMAAFVFQTGPAIASFAGGLVLAAVLLRGQEVAVRSMLQPQEKMMGMDPRLAMMLLLPLKFAGVVAVLVAFNALGWLRPAPLALGFFAANLVLIAKFAGWMLMRFNANKTQSK